MKSTRTLVVIALLAALAGCTRVLHTDFTSATGPWPNGPLPGPPSGDSAQVSGEVLGLGSSVSLLSTTAAGIELVTGGKPHNTQGYAIEFSGVKLTIEGTPVIAVDALDSSGHSACRLEISGGQFRLVGGDGENVIGAYSANADEHRVFMRLNLGSGTCGMRIEQVAQGSGPDAPPTQPLITALAPLITPGFSELDRLRIRWEQTEGASATQYFIGHVTISKDNQS
jgi:hypothetical protein